MSEESSKKIGPLDLRFEEFMSGSQTLIRRHSALPGHAETLREYAEYVEFLAAKRKGYQPLAVLQFDDDLRKYAVFEECSLNAFHCFSNLLHQHFHSGTLLTAGYGFRGGRGGRGGRGMPFCGRGVYSRGQQAPYNFQSAPYIVPTQSRFPCFAWNSDNCPNPASECDYSHICRFSNLFRHTWNNCEKRPQIGGRSGYGRSGQQESSGY